MPFTLPDARIIAVTDASDAVPPVRVTLFDASVENLPAADVPSATPIGMFAIEPPDSVAADDVSVAPEIAPPVICAFAEVIDVNVPAADVVAPIVTLSIDAPLAPLHQMWSDVY